MSHCIPLTFVRLSPELDAASIFIFDAFDVASNRRGLYSRAASNQGNTVFMGFVLF